MFSKLWIFVCCITLWLLQCYSCKDLILAHLLDIVPAYLCNTRIIFWFFKAFILPPKYSIGKLLLICLYSFKSFYLVNSRGRGNAFFQWLPLLSREKQFTPPIVYWPNKRLCRILEQKENVKTNSGLSRGYYCYLTLPPEPLVKYEIIGLFLLIFKMRQKWYQMRYMKVSVWKSLVTSQIL